MGEKVPAVVCSFELDNGYIFKNYFAFCLRGRPVITLTNNKILSGNCTADDQLYGESELNGDEIDLTWDQSIPHEQRSLTLLYEAQRLQGMVGRIRKKDQARLMIAQLRDPKDTSSNAFMNTKYTDFVFFISCGAGGDGREGLKSTPATRVFNQSIGILHPIPLKMSRLIIPIRHFRQMIESFNKCKKEVIKICFYRNQVVFSDKVMEGRPGVLLTTDVLGTGNSGAILEKFGTVPDEPPKQVQVPQITAAIQNLKIDEKAIVRPTGQSIQLILEEEKVPEPHEFLFSADKVAIFAKFAAMHNEGNVRICYQPGCHLEIKFRFGAFGESGLYLANKCINKVI